MLPIVDQPVVQYVIGELAGAGIERVLFVTGAGDRTIVEHFDRAGPLASADSLELLYAPQPEPNGLGGALLEAGRFAGAEGVVVALGDAIIEPPEPGTAPIVRRLADAYRERGAAAAIAVAEVAAPEVSRYGIVVASGARDVLDVTQMVEKPAPGAVPSRLAVAARYVLGPSVFAALRELAPDDGGEIQLTDALRRVIAGGERVIAVRLGPGERRHDIGTVEGYCAAFVEHALRHPVVGPSLRARATVWLDG
jgi:UTP--glucose-1-phosphate uridylyltransferase